MLNILNLIALLLSALGTAAGEGNSNILPKGKVLSVLKSSTKHKLTGYFKKNDARDIDEFNYEEEVNFRLFTKENGLNYQNLSVAKPELLQNSNFDPTKKTKLITHGFEDSANTHTVTDIRDAYQEVQDVNIITVDWKRISYLDYITAAIQTEPIGKHVARLIDQLVEVKGASYSDMHFTGHSLGAHLAGYTGANN